DDKVDKMSKDFIKNHFQDMNSFKLSFSQAMNLQQNKISNDESFPFEDGNNNNKVDEMSQELVENPFQDINNDNSFKVEFSQVMNLKQNNVDTKQSLLDKVNSAQSNSNIPDINNDADDKFPFV
ncbi:MAG: hypothetical protein IJU86_00505, partial [Firmicutes bacterium]|nr:hypothetical protein [Bacillota bacterium]